MFITLVAILISFFLRARSQKPTPVFPHAPFLITLVLVVQNIIAQMITGPLSEIRELHFNIYYLILLAISASILFYFHRRRRGAESLTEIPRTALHSIR
jgi:hypothetical protein